MGRLGFQNIGSGFRVGWVAPGKFKEKIIRQKLVQTVSGPSLFSDVIADFLAHGRYDHHLRMFRKKIIRQLPSDPEIGD